MVGPGDVAVAMVWRLENGLQLVEGAVRNEAHVVSLSFLPFSSRTETEWLQLAIPSLFQLLIRKGMELSLSLSLPVDVYEVKGCGDVKRRE